MRLGETAVVAVIERLGATTLCLAITLSELTISIFTSLITLQRRHRACLDDSGTYRVSAQNHKGEISSYATLVVRRYDKSRSGCYEITSGYNLKKPTDYPDVEKLDVPGK